MNTPNNAAALERLEQKWRESAETERDYYSDALVACANELATLRATLAQPDALTSQPGGGGEPVGTLTVRRWRGIDAMVNHEFDYYGSLPDGSYSLYTHPAADAPSPEVDEAMVRRALDAFGWIPQSVAPVHEQEHMMRSALSAALAPKPEGGHG